MMKNKDQRVWKCKSTKEKKDESCSKSKLMRKPISKFLQCKSTTEKNDRIASAIKCDEKITIEVFTV
jgi:hypothetical protein